MRRWALAAVVLTLPLTARAQSSAPPPFQLRWSGPTSCPGQAEVVQEAQRLLGASTAAPRAVPIAAEAEITSAKGGFQLLLRLGSGPQTRMRTLEAPICDELAHAAALIVALAVDPSLAEGTDASTPSARVQTCPEATPSPPTPCPLCTSCPSPTALLPVPPRIPARPWHTAFVAGASIAYGELPQPQPRANLGLAYRVEAYWLELSAGAAFAASSRLENGGVATFSQWYAAPRFCFEPELGWARLGGCAVVEVGRIKASGFGVTSPKTQRDWWVAPGVGLQLARRLTSGAELVVSADALLAGVRPRFELASEPVFTPQVIIPALRLAVIGGLF